MTQSRPITGISRLWRRLCGFDKRKDGGFTIVELMVASGVLLTALTMIGGVITSSLKATGISRERDASTQLANKTVEQIRALSYDTVKRGLDVSDLAGDSNITSGCGGHCFGGERIVETTIQSTDRKPPLYPHVGAPVTVGPSVYTVKSYITFYKDSTGHEYTDAYRTTVFVSWSGGLQGGAAKTTQVQTVIYAPTGCLSTANHPIPGPCDAAFNTWAKANAGTVSINGTIGTVTVDHAQLSTARASTEATMEQVSDVQSFAQASGGTLQATGLPERSFGSQTASSRASNDPTGSGGAYDSNALPGTTIVPLTTPGGELSITTAGGDSGRSTSTTLATAANQCPRLATGVTPYTSDENDSQVCAGAYARQAASVRASATLGPLGSLTLADVGPQAGPTTTIVDRNLASASGKCPATSGDGCARAQVDRAVGTFNIGALPTNFTSILGSALKLLNGGYFVSISGLADSIAVEGGPGTSQTTATQSGLTLRYWSSSLGGSLVSLTLAQINALTGPLQLPTLTIAGTSGLSAVNVTLNATVEPGSITKSAEPAGCTTTCTHLESTAKSQAPKVTVHYQIAGAGQSQDLTLVSDLGSIEAQSAYTPSPTVGS